MVTKLKAAKRVVNVGIDMILANGVNPYILLDIVEGKEVGTMFLGKR